VRARQSSVARCSFCVCVRERLAFHCRTTSTSNALCTPRRTCCPFADVLITVPRVSRSCELFSDGFDLHLLRDPAKGSWSLHSRKVDTKLSGEDNSNFHSARQVHEIISVIKCNWTGSLTMKNCVSLVSSFSRQSSSRCCRAPERESSLSTTTCWSESTSSSR